MAIRDDFPILQRNINGHPLVYLDNAATTQKPSVVIEAMNEYYTMNNANVHRAVHTLAGEATNGYEACRTTLKSWFNADRCIMTGGTTEAINLAAHAWGHSQLKGRAIILTEMEHHSDIVPWQMLAESFGNVNVKPIKESKGSSSKPVASTKPANEKVLTEGNELQARFKKLANIL